MRLPAWARPKQKRDIHITVLSRAEMEKQLPQKPHRCVISINDPGVDYLAIEGPTLFLSFRDTEDDTGISRIEAEAIYQFIYEKMKKGYTDIVVHCTEGISRSAGVAAALMRALGLNEMDILKNPKYCINGRCYEFVAESFLISVPDEERELKKKISRDAYMRDWPKF